MPCKTVWADIALAPESGVHRVAAGRDPVAHGTNPLNGPGKPPRQADGLVTRTSEPRQSGWHRRQLTGIGSAQQTTAHDDNNNRTHATAPGRDGNPDRGP
ncbi:hypothetical protein TPA0909_11960 [Streptomyces albus]|nr:hypothetical protein TPA0909_11960 [Streptomyces albus]